MAKAIIFDMDGVVIDSEPLHARFVGEYLKSLGVNDRVDLARFYGQTTRDMWSVLKEELRITMSLEELVPAERAAYIAFLEQEKLEPVEGVRELLSDIRDSGMKLALATAANVRRMKLVLERTGLTEAFEACVSGDDVERGKPAPDLFLLAAERLGTAPTSCVVIEDSRNGIAAAKNAGMYAIGFAGLAHNEGELSDADKVVERFRDLNSSMLKAL